MSNIFIVTEIKLTTTTSAVVNWIYGTDEKSVQLCSVVDVSSIPLSDRQSFSIVGDYLKDSLGSSFFEEKDAELLTLETYPPHGQVDIPQDLKPVEEVI